MQELYKVLGIALVSLLFIFLLRYFITKFLNGVYEMAKEVPALKTEVEVLKEKCKHMEKVVEHLQGFMDRKEDRKG